MSMAEKIKILMIKRNDMSLKDLAEKIETSPQNLSNKLKRDDFSEREIIKIAEALNCDFESAFVLRDTKERV